MSGRDSAARPRRERRLWGPDLRRDVDDEIAFHLEQRERDLMASGVTAHEARAEAARRFGNVRDIAAACRHIDAAWQREQRRASMWNDLRQDLAFALRTLFKNRGFAATAIVTLAIGIGANAAIFSVINGILFRRLPFREPDRLVFAWSTSEAFAREPLTPGRFLDFREGITSLSGAAGISQIPINLTGSGNPERIAGSSVSSSFFDVLGARALHGDPFHTGTADPDAVVLSYGLWMRRFGGDPAIVGSHITLNGSARTVVAVMPAEFDWPAITATPGRGAGPELWIPGTVRDIPRMPVDRADIASDRRSGYLRMVARLAPGVSLDQARHEAQAVAVRLGEQYPRDDGSRGATLVPLREQFVGHLQEPMFVLFGAVGLVLAIACANIASLLLGRGAARRKEIALRLALGASRARVVRQLLTESTVLAFVSAGVGVIAAWWVLQWLEALSATAVPGIQRAALDGRVLLFTLGLSIVTGLVCGLVPAFQASSFEIAADLGEESGRVSGGGRSGRTRDVLVAAEIAVALMLLVGAGLLLRSFHSLSRVNTGIDASNLLTFEMFLTGDRAHDTARQIAFYRESLDAISALPGVRRAAGAATLPIGGDNFASAFTIEGRPLPPPGNEPRAGYQVVTPGYFETMGIRVVEGRDFSTMDDERAPGVVMVNETFVRQHWTRGKDPVGRRLRMGRDDEPWLTVIGVVADIRHLGPATPPRPELYQPYAQRPFSFMSFVVRTDGDPTRLVPSVRAALARLDSAQAISGVNTMEQHLDTALSRPKFMSRLVAVFGLLALILSTVGVYGVMAYSVTQRRREIAIRAALGATRTNLMSLVLWKALWLSAAGIAAGVAGAAGLSGVLSGLLFGVPATDGETYAAVVVLLAAVAMLAAAVPALRASRIPGAQVLRG